jgi:hypothetical protein
MSYTSAYLTCDYLLLASAPEPRHHEEAQSPFGELIGQENDLLPGPRLSVANRRTC